MIKNKIKICVPILKVCENYTKEAEDKANTLATTIAQTQINDKQNRQQNWRVSGKLITNLREMAGAYR